MNKRPVFISLVGAAAETNELYDQLMAKLPESLPGKLCQFLGDPFKDYAELRINGRRKRDYTPGARTLLRWAFFYEFNARVVKPAFENNPDVVVVRRFGYDLVAGALAYNDCERSLTIHERLIPSGVVELGLCPPLYLFTQEIGDSTQLQKERYFSLPNQRAKVVDHQLRQEEKLRMVVEIIRGELPLPVQAQGVAAA